MQLENARSKPKPRKEAFLAVGCLELAALQRSRVAWCDPKQGEYRNAGHYTHRFGA
jgi:hypothetical protein